MKLVLKNDILKLNFQKDKLIVLVIILLFYQQIQLKLFIEFLNDSIYLLILILKYFLQQILSFQLNHPVSAFDILSGYVELAQPIS